jgi:hypothetical protein
MAAGTWSFGGVMQQSGLVLHVISGSATISACVESWQWLQALGLLAGRQKSGLAQYLLLQRAANMVTSESVSRKYRSEVLSKGVCKQWQQ